MPCPDRPPDSHVDVDVDVMSRRDTISGPGDGGGVGVPTHDSAVRSWRRQWQRFRHAVAVHVVHSKWFDPVVLLFILGNCVSLAIDNPLDDASSAQERVLRLLDLVRRVRGSALQAMSGRRWGHCS